MSSSEPLAPAAAAVDEQVVTKMAAIARLALPADRIGVVTQRLMEMHHLAADLDSVELGDAEPATRFDAAWQKEATR